jgi:outer membrane protein OmpA-like peptidoglycan-associated protein
MRGGEPQISARSTDTQRQAVGSETTQAPQAAASGATSARVPTASAAEDSAEQDGGKQDVTAAAPGASASASEAQTPATAANSSEAPTPGTAADSSEVPVGAHAGAGPAGLGTESPARDSSGAHPADTAASSSAAAPQRAGSEPGDADRQAASSSAEAANAANGGEARAATEPIANANDQARPEAVPSAGGEDMRASTAARQAKGEGDTSRAASGDERARTDTTPRSSAAGARGAVDLAGGAPQPFAEAESAGSSIDQRPAPAQQIAGIVEAPGRTVTSHDVVVPQRLDGLLPMTIGVEGNGEFDFDRAVLRPEVKPRLDQLADKLNAAEYDRLEIIGHTDRIGTTDYNQYLSERRAWAVARYLVARGVPQEKLHVEGRGTREPLTTPEECPFEAREQLIPCLQKDRRVEISASIRKADVQVQ